MKRDFKITNEFHNTLEESLDNIMNTTDKTRKNRMIRKVSTIAASLIILAVVTIFTANAAGVINLDETFKSIFGLENNEQAQQYALKLASAPVAESKTGDVTARVLQSVNDESSAFIMLELETKDKIFNNTVIAEKYKFKIENSDIDGYQVMSPNGFSSLKKQTIEEAKEELEQLKKSNYTLYDETPEQTKKRIEEEIKFSQTKSNKIILVIEFDGNQVSDKKQSYLGKEISLSIDELKGYTTKGNGEENKEFTIDCDIDLKWKLSSNAKTKSTQINKEYNGASFKEIKLMPLQMFATFNTPIGKGQDDYSDVNFKGVRYKDGSTEAVDSGTGSYGDHDYQLSYLNFILDVDAVVSIFVGENFTEIPLQ